jgi:predicted DNA-binding transcriptional regulator AlpA
LQQIRCNFTQFGAMMKRYISKSFILARLANISDTTLWRMCNEGKFPKPISISANRKGWDEDEVNAWFSARSSENQKAA